ncbi:MAG TPA: hypothetical protein PK006_05735 [Saprospiraceae bacterium]|nr:hypothetical protein [Saprospiraceae bacterium]
MKIKFYILIILSYLGCRDADNCPDRFHIPCVTTPFQETYKIGDTIFFSSVFDKYVHELQTDKKYKMENINWFPNMAIVKLDTFGNGYIKISNYFTISQNMDESTYNRGHSIYFTSYNFSKDTYSLFYYIIPKKEGLYLLYQKCGIGDNSNQQDFPGKCRGNSYDVIVDMNAGTDSNFNLLREAKDSFYNTHIINIPDLFFYNKGGFCFRVVP